MMIGIYGGHAFLIKNIDKLAKTYVCVDCRLASHKIAAFKDKLKHAHKGKQLSIPQTSGSKLRRHRIREHFTTKSRVRRVESTSKVLGKQIHHALCWHGGERWFDGESVVGYAPTPKARVLIPWLPLERLSSVFSKQRRSCQRWGSHGAMHEGKR